MFCLQFLEKILMLKSLRIKKAARAADNVNYSYEEYAFS